MNNGKVRIYELSKELELENKDILAICDKLDIAVKSHSSTISEEEATKIKSVATADGYKPARKAVRPKSKTSRSPAKPSAPKPARPRQQQILEIRRHQPSEVQPPDSKLSAPNPPSDTPNQGDGAAADNLRKPPSRPGRPKPAIRVASKPVPRPTTAASGDASSSTPSSKGSSGPGPQIIQPRLVSPPSRSTSAPKPRGLRLAGESDGRTSDSGSGEPKAKPTLLKEKPSLKPKPVIEIRRPKPSSPGTVDSDDDVSATDDDNVSSGPVLVGAPRRPDVRRPSAPTRPPKRGKPRGESEEEEMRQRASKNATKKRRAQRLDEDEDIDDLDGNASGDASATPDRKSTRLNSSHVRTSRMPSSA